MLWILPEILSRHRRVLILRRGSKSIESSPAKIVHPLGEIAVTRRST